MKKRILAGLLALSMLCGLAACGVKAAATTMRLMRTEGQVHVFNGAGSEVTPRENLGLYSGYAVDTLQRSFAWINLDYAKLTKLDEDSEIEITKSGKSLEINVVSGSLFFNVTRPLSDDETMDIRTSTMAVGIRGTCGWVTENAVCLLEGTVSVIAGEQSATITAGEMAVMTADGALEVKQLSNGDIPAFVLAEIEDDEALMGAVSGGGDPATPSAGPAPGSYTDSGSCGDDVWWGYDDSIQTLIIGGTGRMTSAPWIMRHRDQIQAVMIENGVTSIGYEAFMECSGLTNITIPNSVASIEDSAFCGCTGLTGIAIPDSVTTIGYNVFSSCGLTDITIPGSVTTIEGGAFRECAGLTSVTIPNSVTSIGVSAFDSCAGLTSITLPNSVTSIEFGAFFRCTGLTSITLPNGVAGIDEYAFGSCTSLTSIAIPNSVTFIGHGAFDGCSSLTSVTIPSSVTLIGSSAFGGCASLTDVYYTGTETQWAAISIDNSNSYLLTATIHYNSPG